MNDISYAVYSIKKNFKNAKQLKTSFLITIFGMFLNNFSFVIIWYYFGKTVGVINGWKPLDIFGLYAFSTGSFGIINAFFSGITYIPDYISSGTFDQFLLSPKNILLRISSSKISTSALGDFLFGLMCLIIFGINNSFNIASWIYAIILLIIASVMYYAFTLICMSLSFYFMDGKNISNGIYNIFVSASIYHGGAFTGILKIIFVFIIPSLLIGAIPVEILLNNSISKLFLLISLVIIWLGLSILFFYKSMKKYESNNLFGFGNN